ncbi:hypothetical protein F2Q69_00030353 [Brassica cretica]|uniref:Uncharacterized protein n=1 Tax=Brassica cretica TaxID=69181 RepID=A0A8S9S1X3_BRACR|nr:hypothetical protein F2Q69_00030353 [Brassica cretica]
MGTKNARDKTNNNCAGLTLVNIACLLLPPHLRVSSWVNLLLKPLCYPISSHAYSSVVLLSPFMMGMGVVLPAEFSKKHTFFQLGYHVSLHKLSRHFLDSIGGVSS